MGIEPADFTRGAAAAAAAGGGGGGAGRMLALETGLRHIGHSRVPA